MTEPRRAPVASAGSALELRCGSARRRQPDNWRWRDRRPLRTAPCSFGQESRGTRPRRAGPGRPDRRPGPNPRNARHSGIAPGRKRDRREPGARAPVCGRPARREPFAVGSPPAADRRNAVKRSAAIATARRDKRRSGRPRWRTDKCHRRALELPIPDRPKKDIRTDPRNEDNGTGDPQSKRIGDRPRAPPRPREDLERTRARRDGAIRWENRASDRLSPPSDTITTSPTTNREWQLSRHMTAGRNQVSSGPRPAGCIEPENHLEKQ